MSHPKYIYKGMPLKTYCRGNGLSSYIVYYRVSIGLSIEDAVRYGELYKTAVDRESSPKNKTGKAKTVNKKHLYKRCREHNIDINEVHTKIEKVGMKKAMDHIIKKYKIPVKKDS